MKPGDKIKITKILHQNGWPLKEAWETAKKLAGVVIIRVNKESA